MRLLRCILGVAYQLSPGERVPAGIKRIVREEIESAIRELRGQGEADLDEAIHEARKSMKKIRGVLRLVRPELGENYSPENTNYRDIGQLLSQFRDAGAMVETFDALRKKYRTELGGVSLASIRRGLIARKQQTEKHGEIQKVLKGMAAMLRQSGRRVAGWPVTTDGFAAIAPGLEDTFRRGQNALARIRKRPNPLNYHEWRKRVKDHWYHVRLLERCWDGTMPAYERRLKDLETWLGEDHNVVVLQEKVMSEPDYYAPAQAISAFRKLIAKYQRELRTEAMAAGRGIYGVKPRQLTSRIRRMWQSAHDPNGSA